MATSWGIYKYRDPEKLDISVLGKAMQYKQQMYDTNVAQVQQLVNQYAGTDLLRDVDKQYFGERLNTIVNYINESGTRDWSRKSVATDIQNYVSQALDRNVLSAIGSTQAYRKQMAEIEDIKKNKPDQYSMQNEWFATQDYQRYMTSGQVGDTYRAQSYVPYTDVSKLLLSNSEKLKQFGVEYHFDPIGGNQYFTKIGSYERIGEQEAKQYMDMILDTKAKNQLYIDGQYSFKDTNPENVAKMYESKLDTYKVHNNEQINDLKLRKLNAKPSDKSKYDDAIAQYESSNKNIDARKSQGTSLEAMKNDLYMSDFQDRWIDFLSYDKLKDWKIDQSGFELEKYRNQLKTEAWDKQQKLNEFNYKIQKDSKDRDFDYYKLGVEAQMKGYKMNEDGSISLDPNNPLNESIFPKDGTADLNKENKPDALVSAQSEFNTASQGLESTVASKISSILKDPKNTTLANQLKGMDSKYLAWQMVNRPGFTSKLMQHLSPQERQIVDKVRETGGRLKKIDEQHEPVIQDLLATAESMLSSDKKSTRDAINSSTDGYIINSKGEVTKGDLSSSKGRYASLNKQLAGINFALMTGNMNHSQKEHLKRMATTVINKSTLTLEQKKRAISDMVYERSDPGFWNKVGSYALTALPDNGNLIGMTSKGWGSFLSKVTGDENYRKTGNTIFDKINKLSGNAPNTENTKERIDRYVDERFSVNKTLNALGSGIFGDDVNTNKLKQRGIDINNIEQRLKTNIDNSINTLENEYETIINKRFDIPFTSEQGKKMLPQFSAMLPVGSEIQKEGIAQVNVDTSTGMANVTMAVKDGKEYKPVTIPMKISELPSVLTNQLKLTQENRVYSSKNPYAVKYQTEVDIPVDKADWYSQVEMMPESQRQEALNNPPFFQKDVINKLVSAYGSPVVEKHKAEIEKLLNSSISISTEPMGETWMTVGRVDGRPVYTLDNKSSEYNPVLMDAAKNKIATEIVLEQIKNIMK